MTDVRVLVFAGSLRKASLNHRLAVVAAAAAEAAGAQVSLLRLSDYAMRFTTAIWRRPTGCPKRRWR